MNSIVSPGWAALNRGSRPARKKLPNPSSELIRNVPEIGGCVFTISADGTSYAVLHAFEGRSGDGARNVGEVAFDQLDLMRTLRSQRRDRDCPVVVERGTSLRRRGSVGSQQPAPARTAFDDRI